MSDSFFSTKAILYSAAHAVLSEKRCFISQFALLSILLLRQKRFIEMSFSSKVRAAISTITVVSIAALGIISPAAAQDQTKLLSTNEFSIMTGYLYEGESVYAICDEDCSDINLYLYNQDGSITYDEYGNAVANIATDSFPVVTAPYEGTYRIKAYMSSCSTSICKISVSSDSGF